MKKIIVFSVIIVMLTSILFTTDLSGRIGGTINEFRIMFMHYVKDGLEFKHFQGKEERSVGAYNNVVFTLEANSKGEIYKEGIFLGWDDSYNNEFAHKLFFDAINAKDMATAKALFAEILTATQKIKYPYDESHYKLFGGVVIRGSRISQGVVITIQDKKQIFKGEKNDR